MGKHRILVVEDERLVAEDIKVSLLELGYLVSAVVSSGEDALKKAAQLKPDLVLMDIIIQGEIDGIEAAAKIRTQYNIPVVYLTAYADEETLERAKITEPFGYIIKPFNERELYCIIEMALYKHTMERKITESEARHRLYFENASDVIYSVDQTLKIVSVSPSVERILGYTPEELMGESFADLNILTPESLARAISNAKRILSGEPRAIAEYEFIAKDGTRKFGEISGAPINSHDGEITGIISIARDITERRQAEQALREERDKAQQYLDIARVILMAINTHGEVTLINKKGCEILGYKEEEIVGKNWFDNFLPKREVEKIKLVSQKLLAGEIEFVEYVENPILTNRGEEKLIAWHNTMLRDENGDIIGHLSSGEDISERKRAEQIQAVLFSISQAACMSGNLEELLKIIHQQLSTLIDTTNFYVALYNKDDDTYTFPFYVDECDKLEDYSPKQLKKSLTDYVRRNAEPLFVEEERFQHLLNKGEIELVGTRSPIWLGVPLKTAHEVIGVVAVQSYKQKTLYLKKDIELMTFVSENIATAIERKRAATALIAEKERLAVTLHSIGEAVISTDVNGKIILINRVAEKLTGWNIKEAVGNSIEEVFVTFNEKTRESCLNPVKKIIENGVVIEHENHTILLSKDGTERIIANSGAPIFDRDNKIIGVVLVFRDITGIKKLEQEIQKASKLESIGIFAGGIAHDFNNFLTSILCNTSLARIETDPENEIYEMLADTEKAALMAQQLTQQLLTFAKGGTPIKKIISIADLIKDSARFVLRGSSARCVFSIPDNLWPVEIDEGQVNQVVNNLIINADQAMPQGGVIQVGVENVIIKAEHALPLQNGKYIKIYIKDQGIGIAEEHLSQIFDPYFTTKQKGSGLGLATSYSIINKHGGCIKVESKQNEWTIFYIYLPASKKEFSLDKNLKEGLLAGKGRILVMDDEEIVRKTMTSALKRIGFEVESAADGAEAIELYEQAIETGNTFKAVFMDLTIPGGMGGLQTFEKLHEIDPAVKAIVSSGYSSDPIMANYSDYGFSGCITKPFEIKELSDVLKTIL